jgi:hypothetical protein
LIDTLRSFRKMQQLTTDREVVVRALKASESLQVDDEEKMVKKVTSDTRGEYKKVKKKKQDDNRVTFNLASTSTTDSKEKSTSSPDISIPSELIKQHPHNKAIASIYGDERTADIILYASDRDRKFYAHKNVLACQSQYFYAQCYNGKQDVTELRVDVTAQTLTSVLKFAYTVDIIPSGLGVTELIDLYNAGEKLGLPTLSLHCLVLMTKNQVNTSNVCALWPWLVQRTSNNEKQQMVTSTLIQRCRKCIREQPAEVFEARKYLTWEKGFLFDHFLPHMCTTPTSLETTTETVHLENEEVTPLIRQYVLKIICEWIRCNLGVAYDKRGSIATVSPFTSMEDVRYTVRKLFQFSNELLEDGQNTGGLQFFTPFFQASVTNDNYLKNEAILKIYQTIVAGVL